MSTSVLQQERITFSPQLPADKLDSIRKIDTGTLNYVYMHFERCLGCGSPGVWLLLCEHTPSHHAAAIHPLCSAFWDADQVPASARHRRYIVDVNAHDSPLSEGTETEAIPLHFINLNKLQGVPVLAAVLHGPRAQRMVRRRRRCRCADAVQECGAFLTSLSPFVGVKGDGRGGGALVPLPAAALPPSGQHSPAALQPHVPLDRRRERFGRHDKPTSGGGWVGGARGGGLKKGAGEKGRAVAGRTTYASPPPSCQERHGQGCRVGSPCHGTHALLVFCRRSNVQGKRRGLAPRVCTALLRFFFRCVGVCAFAVQPGTALPPRCRRRTARCTGRFFRDSARPTA